MVVVNNCTCSDDGIAAPYVHFRYATLAKKGFFLVQQLNGKMKNIKSNSGGDQNSLSKHSATSRQCDELAASISGTMYVRLEGLARYASR